MNPHHPANPGQPAAGVGQIGGPGARPGPGLGAIGQNGGQQLGRIIGRGSRHWRMRLPLRVPDGGQGTAAGNQPEYRATWPTGVYAAGMQSTDAQKLNCLQLPLIVTYSLGCYVLEVMHGQKD